MVPPDHVINVILLVLHAWMVQPTTAKLVLINSSTIRTLVSLNVP